MGLVVRSGILLVAVGLSIFFGRPLFAQVYFSAQGADFRMLTQYRNATVQDTIWVYYRKPNEVGLLTLRGECHGNASRKLVVRRWETDGWDARNLPIDSVESAPLIECRVSEPGAYELLGIQGADTARRRIWVMVDDVEFVRIGVQNDCEGLRMGAEFNTDYGSIRYDKFTYYDMSQAPPRELNDLGDSYFSEVVWEDKAGNPVELFGLRVSQTSPPPFEEVFYRLRIRTLFGKQFAAETGAVSPVAVEAKFKVFLNKAPERAEGQWEEAGVPPKGIAPLHMRMESESKNADELLWVVRNDVRVVRQGGADTLFLGGRDGMESSIDVPADLFTAGQYRLLLQVRNTGSGCVDTMALNLQVDSSLLSLQAIPNVFSPNGDGVNDLFQFVDRERNVRGIRDFHMRVFNRHGQSVYEYRGEVRDWQGWNGERNGNGRVLDPGAYFYIIQATGWDGRQYRGVEYKGVLHLFR